MITTMAMAMKESMWTRSQVRTSGNKKVHCPCILVSIVTTVSMLTTLNMVNMDIMVTMVERVTVIVRSWMLIL